MSSAFETTRANGRTNTQVICDFVGNGEPGRIYTYAELAEALSDGTEKTYTQREVQSLVNRAIRMLHEVHRRDLQNVRHQGYRLIRAEEHRALAVVRKERSTRQLRVSLSGLQHVRWEEMDEQNQRAHRAHLMITEALVQNQFAMEKRMRKAEEAIEHLIAEARKRTAA